MHNIYYILCNWQSAMVEYLMKQTYLNVGP